VDLQGEMEGHGEMGCYGDPFGPENMMGEDGEDSGTGNYDLVSVEDHPEGASENNRRTRRKRYHRHTPLQIQELEK